MADTIRFLLPQDRLHPTFNVLDLQLASRRGRTHGGDDGGFQLNIANAFWAKRILSSWKRSSTCWRRATEPV